MNYKGKIIKWFEGKGYGFVESGDRSYFLHINDTLNKDIEIGQEIKFKLVEYKGRPVAKEISDDV